MKVVLWDLDSTLCNTVHRQDMIPAIRASENKGPTWDEYSLACEQDTPVEGAVALSRFIAASGWLDSDGAWHEYTQFGVSGRGVCAYYPTLGWLRRHNVPLTDVFLRATDDFDKGGVIKARVIEKLRAMGHDVALFVEDWKEDAAVIRERTGVPVLLTKGEYLEDEGPV